MGIINTSLRAVKTGFNHIRPNSNFGTLAPVRKATRQSMIDAKHVVAEGIETGAVTSSNALADVTADVAERTGELVEQSAQKMVDAEVEKIFAKSQKGWIGKHPVLATGAALGATALVANSLKGNGYVAPTDAYGQGEQAAQQDVYAAMQQAAPMMDASTANYQGTMSAGMAQGRA